jgi:hypothetical protein
MVIVAVVALGAAVQLGGGPASVLPSGTPGAAGAGLQPRVAPRPAGADAALIAGIPTVRLARVVIDTRISGSAGGPPLASANGDPITVSAGMQLVVFEGPVSVGADLWFRVSPLSNPNTGPADYVAWLPLHDAQRAETIAFRDPPVCPGGEGISVLAALDPFTRASCIGATSLTMRGWTWNRLLPTWYQITPAWLGEQNGPVDSTISLHDAGPRLGGSALDLQVPPDLERPPFEFQIEVTAHVGDPASGSCVRSDDQTSLVPPDDPRDGHIWCATRFVIEQWTPLLGPEDRVIDPDAPQLHRHPAGNGACAGVGMAMLVFRMDPTQLDPVWLEVIGGNGFRIIPSFDPSFRVTLAPNLEIIDASGQVVATDGTVVNPDGRLSGHFICPTGRIVFFD